MLSIIQNDKSSDLQNPAEQFIADIRTIKETLIELSYKTDADFPMGVDTAAKFLRKSTSTIYTLCSKALIPHYKKGNTTYFFRSELLEWVKEGKVLEIQKN